MNKDYSTGGHTKYRHRYHLVWITKYRYKVLVGELQKRVREIISQVAEEMDVSIVGGAISNDHVHIFCEIPPQTAVSEFVKKAKGRSSYKVQREGIGTKI